MFFNKINSRIVILTIAGILSLFVFLSVHVDRDGLNNNPPAGNVRFNTDYRIKRMSNGEVIVLSKSQSKEQFSQRFKDLSADLILGLYRNQSMDYIMTSIAKKYYLTKDECRREVKSAINVLVEWNIIIRENPLLSP
jgi:hypothetical protein